MNIKKAIVTLLFIVILASAVSMVNMVNAGTATGIIVMTGSNTPGDISTEFNLDDWIYIGWSQSPSSGTVDIAVTNPAGAPVQLTKVSTARALPSGSEPTNQVWANQGSSEKWCLCFKGTIPGQYKITGTGALYQGSITIGIGTILVLPESILGTIMTVGAGFAAFGAFGLVKSKRFKKN